MTYSGTIYLVSSNGNYLGMRDYKNRDDRKETIERWRRQYRYEGITIHISPDLDVDMPYSLYKRKLKNLNGHKITYL